MILTSIAAARSMRGLKARTNFVYPAHQTCILSAALTASRASKENLAQPAQKQRKFDWFSALSRGELQRVLVNYHDIGAAHQSSVESCHDYTDVLENVERLASAISDPPRSQRVCELPQLIPPSRNHVEGTGTRDLCTNGSHWFRGDSASQCSGLVLKDDDNDEIANSTTTKSNLLDSGTVPRHSCEVHVRVRLSPSSRDIFYKRVRGCLDLLSVLRIPAWMRKFLSCRSRRSQVFFRPT